MEEIEMNGLLSGALSAYVILSWHVLCSDFV